MIVLKKTRVGVSLLLFSVLTLYFLDFAALLPASFHLLTRVQLVPALLALNFVVLGSLLVLTLLFGRVYCSSVCPMGVLQDVVDWVAKKVHRKKKYPYFKEQKLLRWGIVVVTVAAFLAGTSLIVSLLDPYSAYGRIATFLFKPLYQEANNGLAWIGSQFKNYRFYKVDIFFSSIAALVTAGVTVLIIGFLAFRWGRLYCNTLCPVGTVLGALSRFSLFKIRIREGQCNSCGLCGMRCKSSCIDTASRTIDHSRCVACFNCLEVCHRKAMSFSPAWTAKEKAMACPPVKGTELSRRKYLATVLLGALAGVQQLFGRNGDSTVKKPEEIYTSHNVPYQREHPITPPGSANVRRFNDRCTACHLCVGKCPSNVLKPSFLEYGLVGLLQPTMDFTHGYCNYQCTVCTDICPTKALEQLSEKEKKTVQVGHVVYLKENCVVETDGTDCGACAEHCPTSAVSMQPYKGDLRIPVIDEELCVGCGGCEYICPTRPFRAIYVTGNPVHKTARIPEEEEQKKIQVDDFGF